LEKVKNKLHIGNHSPKASRWATTSYFTWSSSNWDYDTIRYDMIWLCLSSFGIGHACFHEVICMYQVKSLPAFRILFLFLFLAAS
jgi:hypothetical protein